MGDGTQPQFLGFVGGGGEHFGREFCRPAATIIDPYFDEIRFADGEFAHVFAGVLSAPYRIGHVVARTIGGTGARISEPEADGENACRVGNSFPAQPECEIAHVGAGREHGDDTVIGIALQVIDVIGACEIRFRHGAGDGIEEAWMAVRIDDARHHSLAGEVDARGAGRHRHLAAAADLRDPRTLDDEDGIFDWRAAVAGDEPRAFIGRDGLGLALSRNRRHQDEGGKNGQHAIKIHPIGILVQSAH